MLGTNEAKKEPLPKLYYITATLTSAAVSGANTYVPFYLRSLGATYVVSGIPLVVRGVGRVAFDVSSIYLMGRLHPQRIFLWGVALGAVALLVCGVFPSAYSVIAAYFFVGVGMAMLHIALRQLVFEGSTKGRRGRAMGLLSVFIGCGPILGIALGGVIAEYLGYRSLFLTSGAVILWLPLALAYFMRPENSLVKEPEAGSGLRLGVVREILGTSGAPLLCACSFFSLFYQQARGLAVAFYSTDVVGLSLGSYGLMRSISQLGNVGGRYFGGGWTDKSGIGDCLVGGFLISAVGYGMTPPSTSWEDCTPREFSSGGLPSELLLFWCAVFSRLLIPLLRPTFSLVWVWPCCTLPCGSSSSKDRRRGDVAVPWVSSASLLALDLYWESRWGESSPSTWVTRGMPLTS